MRNKHLVATVFALAILASHASGAGLTRAEQKRIVRSVERVPAKVLDPELPSIALAIWVRQTLGTEATIEWNISDCDLKPDFSQPVPTYPLCVVVRAETPAHIGMKLHFDIGTLGKYDVKHPSLARQSLIARGNILNGCIGQLDRLSSLPKEIERLASMSGCERPAPPNSD